MKFEKERQNPDGTLNVPMGASARNLVVLTGRSLENAREIVSHSVIAKGVIGFTKPAEMKLSVLEVIQSLHELVRYTNPHFKSGAVTEKTLFILEQRQKAGVGSLGRDDARWGFDLRLAVPETESKTKAEQDQILARLNGKMATPEQLILGYLLCAAHCKTVQDPLGGRWARVDGERLGALTLNGGLYLNDHFCDSTRASLVNAPCVSK